LLSLAWVALTGEYQASNFFVGLLLGFAAIRIALRGEASQAYGDRLKAIAGFAIFFSKELIIANFKVAYDVLTPRHHMRPGIIAIPLDLETDLEITVLTTLITLTPGSLCLHVSTDRQTLYLHSMYVDDAEQVVRSIKDGFERRVREVLR
ncbi:MAG: Na+/H+ antiporter subunit E, partial [Desulfuromonadales bacterium]|nr:Na+/H+ antiporter subunit E [Desulfuromonadales bacterium]